MTAPRTTATDPSPKALGAAAGGGIGAALAAILVWVLGEAGHTPPPGIEAALAVILGTVAAYVGGWLPRDPLRDLGQAIHDEELVPAGDVAAKVESDGDLVAGEALPPEGHPVDVTPTGGATSAGWSTALPPEGAVTGPPDKEA